MRTAVSKILVDVRHATFIVYLYGDNTPLMFLAADATGWALAGDISRHLCSQSGTALPARLHGLRRRGMRVCCRLIARSCWIVSPACQAKVKAIADMVWAKLGSCFAKDVLHVQHLSAFTDLLAEGGRKGKLDCAGVVVSTLVVAQHLAAAHPDQHADLATIYMQVSEDHCWITLSPEGAREDSVEITTDNKARRGAAVEQAAWDGWLYNGGGAVVCASPASALAALVVSVNPTIGNRPSQSGPDSRELEALQRSLLSALRAASADSGAGATYPGAVVSLAYLNECADEVELRAAEEAARVEELLRPKESVQGMYEAAAGLPGRGGTEGRHWYPHACLFYFHKYRGDLIVDVLEALGPGRDERGWQHHTQAFAALDGAAAVLQRFRHAKTDEQLYADITCVLANVEDVLKWRAQVTGGPLECSAVLSSFLALWASICVYFAALGVPRGWVDTLLRCAKLFAEDVRERAGLQAAQVGTGPGSAVMQLAAPLWSPLRASALRTVFESPSSGGAEGQPAKRQRRGGR
mmetsp:Transcript_3189/g.7903  ORF Transcript_3189/g.7903 Transcript_3189/m.7903 type:complete len:524 (-) Transcript_3189:184-1755(-)